MQPLLQTACGCRCQQERDLVASPQQSTSRSLRLRTTYLRSKPLIRTWSLVRGQPYRGSGSQSSCISTCKQERKRLRSRLPHREQSLFQFGTSAGCVSHTAANFRPGLGQPRRGASAVRQNCTARSHAVQPAVIDKSRV
jgi:hypothetical protein